MSEPTGKLESKWTKVNGLSVHARISVDPIPAHEEHLPRIQAPTLVVRGAKDPIVRQRWVEEVHQLLPKSRLVVIPGAAHVVNFSSPEQLVRVVREFMDEDW